METYTLIAFTDNSPGVLQRITILFTRRKLNIESLTVSETTRKGISRFTIVVQSERDLVLKVAKQLARIFEVLEVSVHAPSQVCAREVALFELAPASGQRGELSRLLRDSSARVIQENQGRLIVEAVGKEEDISALARVLRPYQITQSVRSGRIALQTQEAGAEDHAMRFVNRELGDIQSV